MRSLKGGYGRREIGKFESGQTNGNFDDAHHRLLLHCEFIAITANRDARDSLMPILGNSSMTKLSQYRSGKPPHVDIGEASSPDEASVDSVSARCLPTLLKLCGYCSSLAP